MPLNGDFFQRQLVTYCAPTLMHMKTGSLFRCNVDQIPNHNECIAFFNNYLNHYDIHVEILKQDSNSLLLYVYHSQRLTNSLSDNKVRSFLHQYDIRTDSLSHAITDLCSKIQESPFPHEIGIFLGYPLFDVQCFITQQHRSKCVGCWRVYGNVHNARKTFKRYKSCTKTMISRLEEGQLIFDTLSLNPSS